MLDITDILVDAFTQPDTTLVESANEELNTFSSEDFSITLEEIRLETIEALKIQYPGSDIDVKLVSHERDYTQQKDILKSGASKSSISLHNFGAAGDFTIYIDGSYYDATGIDKPSEGIYGSMDPYRVLGGVARSKNLFWGWDFDPGHVGETRFVNQFISKYPGTALESEDLKLWYDDESTLTKKSYQPTLELLDSLYDKKSVRKYYGKPRTIDELEYVITPEEVK